MNISTKEELKMDQEDIPDHLKEQINNLLWVVLPSHTTLSEAESIAIKIYEEIMTAWRSR